MAFAGLAVQIPVTAILTVIHLDGKIQSRTNLAKHLDSLGTRIDLQRMSVLGKLTRNYDRIAVIYISDEHRGIIDETLQLITQFKRHIVMILDKGNILAAESQSRNICTPTQDIVHFLFEVVSILGEGDFSLENKLLTKHFVEGCLGGRPIPEEVVHTVAVNDAIVGLTITAAIPGNIAVNQILIFFRKSCQ